MLRYRIEIVRDPMAPGPGVKLKGDATPIDAMIIHRFTATVSGLGAYTNTVNLLAGEMESGLWTDLADVPEHLRVAAKELLVDAFDGYYQLVRHEANHAADDLNRIKKF